MKKKLTAVVLAAAFFVGTAMLSDAEAMRRVRKTYRGGAPTMEHAIRATWPGHLHGEAFNVAWCESTGRPGAKNGQYKGLFQIGRNEWKQHGRGGNPHNAVHNSAAAYRLYKSRGWQPWECQP